MTSKDNNESVYSDPFLLIIHISDLHIVSDVRRDTLSRDDRFKNQLARRLIPELWDDGTADSDISAINSFTSFLKKIINKYYSNVNKWIIDTGDLSNWGDDGSIMQGRSNLLSFKDAINADELLGIYGNHDAWPNAHPFFSRPTAIKKHRKEFRKNHYKDKFPLNPITCLIPSQTNEIQLYSLNSVLHLPWHENVRALGKIIEDMYWKRGATSPLPKVQLQKLANLVSINQGGSNNHDLRILLTHHPIHYPGQKPNWTMHLINDNEVANYLNTGSGSSPTPLAHIILSGHTHNVYPSAGNLTDHVSNCSHKPLTNNQCQFIIGSLSQRNLSGKVGPYSQQAQLLLFHTVETEPGVIAIERRIVARDNEIGDYKFVPIFNGLKHDYSEMIHISP